MSKPKKPKKPTKKNTRARDSATLTLLQCAARYLCGGVRNEHGDICASAVALVYTRKAVAGIAALHGSSDGDSQVSDAMDEIDSALLPVMTLGLKANIWASENETVRDAFWALYDQAAPACSKKLDALIAQRTA